MATKFGPIGAEKDEKQQPIRLVLCLRVHVVRGCFVFLSPPPAQFPGSVAGAIAKREAIVSLRFGEGQTIHSGEWRDATDDDA